LIPVALRGRSTIIKRTHGKAKDKLLGDVNWEHHVDECNIFPCYTKRPFHQCTIRRKRQEHRLDGSTVPASPALETSSIKSAVLDVGVRCQVKEASSLRKLAIIVLSIDTFSTDAT
jgi:hypothetical protein